MGKSIPFEQHTLLPLGAHSLPSALWVLSPLFFCVRACVNTAPTHLLASGEKELLFRVGVSAAGAAGEGRGLVPS